MSDSPPATPILTSASGVMVKGHGDTVALDPLWDERTQRLRVLIDDNLPTELHKLAADLMSSLRHNAGVAERFDAFCVQAFSKPEWAVPASAFIGELFEDNEDRLAELVRVPDLVIELGCGQAAVACTVASKWATRGETHRLSRFAESIIAAQGTMKNAAAVEVMLALSATLAITRPSRAEQLLNAAVPLASEEHAESLADARRWLAAGRSLASCQQDIRDLWDTRLRRPRVAWKWESPEERKALKALAENLSPDSDLAPLVQKIVPACWWDILLQKDTSEQALQRRLDTLSASASSSAAVGAAPLADAPSLSTRKPHREWANDGDAPLGVRPQASSMARFILGWAFGVFVMGLSFFLAPDAMHRFIKDARQTLSPASPEPPPPPAAKPTTSLAPATTQTSTPARKDTTTLPLAPAVPELSGKAWREAQAQKFARHNTAIAHLFAQVKRSKWNDNQLILSGHNAELPFSDERYLQLLVWLHLDPPDDAETCRHLPRLLLDRADSSVLAIWEGLCYAGSPNETDIRRTAQEVYAEKVTTWSREDAERLHMIAQEPNQ
jgi:hypothetical protein